jgi:hypothetical protein
MANERSIKIYKDICSVLDGKGWNYSRKDDKLTIVLSVRGDDLEMGLVIEVDDERQLVRVVSPMPFEMSENKRIEGAIATCAATYTLADGSFDYDLMRGKIYFRLTSSYRGCDIGEGMLDYMVDVSLSTIDRYNDKFMALNKGYINVTDFFD